MMYLNNTNEQIGHTHCCVSDIIEPKCFMFKETGLHIISNQINEYIPPTLTHILLDPKTII